MLERTLGRSTRNDRQRKPRADLAADVCCHHRYGFSRSSLLPAEDLQPAVDHCGQTDTSDVTGCGAMCFCAPLSMTRRRLTPARGGTLLRRDSVRATPALP
jgi:hypothetical protein